MPDEKCYNDLRQRFIAHKDHTQKLISELLKQVGDVNAGISRLSHNMAEKLDKLQEDFVEHIEAEDSYKELFLKEFEEFKSNTKHDLELLNKMSTEIMPIWEKVRKEQVIWSWVTDDLPRYLQALYKIATFMVAVGAGVWAFFEFIIKR